MPAWGWEVVHGRSDVTLEITDDFQIAGIALGMFMGIVYFHLVRLLRERFGVLPDGAASDLEPTRREAGGESTGRQASGRET
jgi:hypothetical protein